MEKVRKIVVWDIYENNIFQQEIVHKKILQDWNLCIRENILDAIFFIYSFIIIIILISFAHSIIR